MDIDFFFLIATISYQEGNPGSISLWFQLHGSPPSLVISLASPSLCGNYEGEKDDCKAVTAANIYYNDFSPCSFPLLFPTNCSFLSVLSSVCFSLYFIPLLMSSFDFFPPLSFPYACFSAFLEGRGFHRCVCSVMGRTQDFSSIFQGNNREKTHTLENSTLWTGVGKVSLQILGMTQAEVPK